MFPAGQLHADLAVWERGYRRPVQEGLRPAHSRRMTSKMRLTRPQGKGKGDLPRGLAGGITPRALLGTQVVPNRPKLAGGIAVLNFGQLGQAILIGVDGHLRGTINAGRG